MQITYQELPEYQFPYWICHQITPAKDDILFYLDVNQWCGEQYGPIGEEWGFEKTTDTSSAPNGMNPVKVRLLHTVINYHWRFKNKDDAMQFKLTWG